MVLEFKESKALPMPSEPGRDMQSMVEGESIDNAAVIETAGVSNDAVEEVETENVETSTTDEKVGNEPPEGSLEWFFRKHRMSINDSVPEPKYLFRIKGVECFPRGDFSVIKAKQKSGKTMTICCFIAALLKGGIMSIESKEDVVIAVHFDLEQSLYSTYKFYERVLKMAGHEGEDIHKRFETINMREQNIEQRLKLIEYVLKTIRPDFVSIDGLVDVCSDFNNLEESERVVDKVMKLSTIYDCHIMCVIHTNPSNENGKARGHLGTIAENKAFETIQLNKDSMGIFTVSSSSSRETPMPSWSFRFDDEGNLISADDFTNTTKEKVKTQKEEQKRSQLISYIDEAIMKNGGSAPQVEIAGFLMEKMNIKSSAVYNKINSVKDNYQVEGKNFSIKTQTRDLENPEEIWDSNETTDDSVF